jgi:hypothetical protein
MLNIIDEFTGESLAIRVKRKLNSIDVIDTLTDLFILRGIPDYIRSDNVLPAVLMELMPIRDSSGITRLPSSHSMLG